MKRPAPRIRKGEWCILTSGTFAGMQGRLIGFDRDGGGELLAQDPHLPYCEQRIPFFSFTGISPLVRCQPCDGSGEADLEGSPCPLCKGTGRVVGAVAYHSAIQAAGYAPLGG